MNHLTKIASQCADVGEPISENFQVSIIIGKLPSSWKDYQNILKHKRKSLNLDELLQHIQIECEARNREVIDNPRKEKIHNVEGPTYGDSKPKRKDFNEVKKGSFNSKRRVQRIRK